MRTDDHSVRQLVDDLSSAALRDLLRNVRHHTELRRQIASGLVDERAVNDAYREYARREGAAYRQQVADITVQYYSDLAELGNRYSEAFYADVLGGLDADARRNGGPGREDDRYGPPDDEAPSTNGAAPRPEAEEVPVELHAPPGREVMASFALENTESQPAELSIEVGPCQGPGGESFMAPLTVQPAQFVLDPGARRSITLRLVMLPTVFVPGHLYRLRVRIVGPTELVLRVTIWAEEPDTPTVAASERAEQPSPPKRSPTTTRTKAASRKPAPKKSPAKKAAAKKTSAKQKTVAKKTTPRKTTAKKTTARKTAAKKTTRQAGGGRSRGSGSS